MLSTTVTARCPGFTVRVVRSATRLVTVTVTVSRDPAEPSDPDFGDTVTLVLALEIEKSTGPPTAMMRNVPLTAVFFRADSGSLTGLTFSVPGGDGELEGDGEADAGPAGDDAADREAGRDVPGDVARPVGRSKLDAGPRSAAAAGLATGAPDVAVEVPKPPPPSATAVAVA
jgi:hypothetical protein